METLGFLIIAASFVLSTPFWVIAGAFLYYVDKLTKGD